MIDDDNYNKYDSSCDIDEEDTSNDETDDENKSSNNSENANYKFKWCGGDMPFGFQKVNPQVFNVIGEILGDVMSNRLPFNVQNAVGNWIQLIGQVIESYSSQQNYFQSGPGRYYDLRYYNVNNPFCTDNDSGSTNNENENSSSSSTSENNTDNMSDDSSSNKEEIENLKEIIDGMQSTIKKLEEKINILEKNKLE